MASIAELGRILKKPDGEKGKMKDLMDKQIIEHVHRLYAASDGLWFMKVEERCGFDSALEIDDQVWKILPKSRRGLLNSMLCL